MRNERVGEFDLGELWDPNSIKPTGLRFGADVELVRGWFPFFCHNSNFCFPNPDDHRLWIPKLTKWERDGSLEIFEIEMRGRFVEMAPKLAKALMTIRRGKRMVETLVDDDPGHIRLLINKAVPPAKAPLDFDKMAKTSEKLYLGPSGVGVDAEWDPTMTPHFLFTGMTGSGKTATACHLLMQVHDTGGRIVVGTPTAVDANFSMFKDLGHTVICGEGAASLREMRKAFQLVAREIGRREKVMGEAGRVVWPGGYIMIVLDEPRFILSDKESDTEEMKKDRAIIWEVIELLALRGRKTKANLGILTQELYAKDFGGTLEVLKQLGLRLAFSGMSSTSITAMFGKMNEQARRPFEQVLGPAASSPPGRGIGIGLVQPGGYWANFPVNATPMQAAFAEKNERRARYGLPPILEDDVPTSDGGRSFDWDAGCLIPSPEPTEPAEPVEPTEPAEPTGPVPVPDMDSPELEPDDYSRELYKMIDGAVAADIERVRLEESGGIEEPTGLGDACDDYTASEQNRMREALEADDITPLTGDADFAAHGGHNVAAWTDRPERKTGLPEGDEENQNRLVAEARRQSQRYEIVSVGGPTRRQGRRFSRPKFRVSARLSRPFNGVVGGHVSAVLAVIVLTPLTAAAALWKVDMPPVALWLLALLMVAWIAVTALSAKAVFKVNGVFVVAAIAIPIIALAIAAALLTGINGGLPL